jgi:sugar phosphate isomerase/epimerase
MPIGMFVSANRAQPLHITLDAVRRLGVTTIHLATPRDPAQRIAAGELGRMLQDAGIRLTAVFCGFAGHDYQSIESVRRTVGLAPESTRHARLRRTFEVADLARELNCSAIAMHLGAIPDPDDESFPAVVDVARQVCDHCARNGQWFHLETGPESADALRGFIERVDRPNLAVNFDPANLILYGTDEPIAALHLLAPGVRSVHCKDATRQRRPGQPWHEDCPLGSGDVGIERFVRSLFEIGYTGPLTIERESAADNEDELTAAVRFLERVRANILHHRDRCPGRR